VLSHDSPATDEHVSEGEHAAPASLFQPGFTLPGLLEIGVLLGFVSGFLLFVFREMGKAALIPKNDPYYSETLHHHVV
jgi:hypothetical protein